MANKQIKDLDLIGSNIDAASDFLIIQKADGSTYKVTVDQLINSSTTVAYGSSTGAPTIISETWRSSMQQRFRKTITRTNMFETRSAGVLTAKMTFGTGSHSRTASTTVTKTAGLDMISWGGRQIIIGGPEIYFQSDVGSTLIFLSCTKDSLTLGGYLHWSIDGQISIVAS